MDYGAAASHAAAAGPPPAADPHHPHYPHPYAGYPYPYAAYNPAAPASEPATAASSSYYYPTAVSAAASAGQYDPYAAYQYYADPAAAGPGSGGAGGLPGYYFGAGEAFQAPASSASQGAPAATAAAGKEAGKHFGFDPQRYAQKAAKAKVEASLILQSDLSYLNFAYAPQTATTVVPIIDVFSGGPNKFKWFWSLSAIVSAESKSCDLFKVMYGTTIDPRSTLDLKIAAAARSSNGVAPAIAAPGMHPAQWNAHFGHPVPKIVSRKHIKKKPKVVQPLTCEVCKIQCDTPEVLRIHKTGKKHKKNLERLQDSITPKPVKPPSTPNTVALAANMAPDPVTTSVTTSVMPAAQTKKKKSAAATPEELEVKRRRVLDAGAAQGEVKICTVCNVVVNSQKVYEFHIIGQKHKAMVQKQQAQPPIA
uniref:U1-type domain-containing protein n=1 Tax=Oryza rufipogon TaxID=4529 RepID=A0A0E0QXJ1_ORYRU